MATTTLPNLHLWAILSESKRILNAHSRHFLALSVIFLLPLSFSLIVSPTLFQLISLSPNTSHVHILLRKLTTTTPFHHHHHHHDAPFTFNINPTTTTLLFTLSFSLFLLFFTLFSLSSITNSVFHGFFGRPVKLPSAIKSIFPSFFPLLFTSLLSQLIILFISLFYTLLIFLLLQVIHHFGITLSYYSPLFLLLFLPLLILLLYIRVSWTLASVISIVESSCGLKPLKRSAMLMKGMKGVGLSSLLFFGFMESVLVWSSSVLPMGSDGATTITTNALFKDWAFVMQIVLASTLLMLLLLYNTAVNTVLYMYCKAVHGELAVEIADEFAREYVSLPFDEGKVPHLVTVVHV